MKNSLVAIATPETGTAGFYYTTSESVTSKSTPNVARVCLQVMLSPRPHWQAVQVSDSLQIQFTFFSTLPLQSTSSIDPSSSSPAITW
jgi:hypothetical protein